MAEKKQETKKKTKKENKNTIESKKPIQKGKTKKEETKKKTEKKQETKQKQEKLATKSKGKNNRSQTTKGKKETKNVSEKKSEDVKKVAEKETVIVEKKELRAKKQQPSKKVGKQYYESSKGKNDELSKLIKIVLILLVIFALFYLITYAIQKIPKKQGVLNTDTNPIQYDEILISKLFKQSNTEYYVLITTEDDPDLTVYNEYISQYKEMSDSIRFYTANLNDTFNRNFRSDTSNLNVETIDNFKVKESSLVHIQNHKVIESFEGRSAIKEKLADLLY